jgi:hypothetical protein
MKISQILVGLSLVKETDLLLGIRTARTQYTDMTARFGGDISIETTRFTIARITISGREDFTPPSLLFFPKFFQLAFQGGQIGIHGTTPQ